MSLRDAAHKLERLGLSKNQAKVYAATMFLGGASVQKIAELSGINRVSVYDILADLEKKKIVTKTKIRDKTAYQAEDPAVLQKALSDQIEKLTEAYQGFSTLMLELSEYRRTANAPSVRFYSGKEGVSNLSRYQHRKAAQGDTIYGMTNVDELKRLYPEKIKTSPKKRAEKKLKSRIIYSSTKEEVKTDGKLKREARKTDDPVRADINIYSDTASLISYGNGLNGILIEDKEIVGGLRQLFELAWGKLESNKGDKKD